MDHEGRIARLRACLDRLDVDAFLVTDLTNVLYLTGFSGTNGQVILTSSDAVFLSDGRYRARAEALVEGAAIQIYPDKLTDVLGGLLAARGIRRLGLEAASVTIAQQEALAAAGDDVHLVAAAGEVERLRRTKEPAEVEAIRAAVRLGDETFTWVLDRLAVGRSEREIALDLEVRMRTVGAESVSFPPIVGSGELSAHIHHTPTGRILEKGDLVLMDFGCRMDGYCSDLTRTVVLGPATEEQQETYAAVLEAQARGITAARPGVPCNEVDAAARAALTEAGHPQTFEHGLGHAVGLLVHEDPRFSKTSEARALAGDVMTVEPGLYPPGWGGIRIEDMIHVTEGGAEVLGRAPKERLIEL